MKKSCLVFPKTLFYASYGNATKENTVTMRLKNVRVLVSVKQSTMQRLTNE